MTSIARVHLTRNKKKCNSAQTTCTCLQWCYWICMQRGYSSMVDHAAAFREEVLVRTRVSPCIIFERLEKMTLIARVHLTRNKKHCNSARTTWACLQWCYWICMQRGYSSVVEHSAAVREVPGLSPGVPLYNFWKTREKWHRSREYPLLGTKNIVTVLKQPERVCSDIIESVCSGERWYSSVVEHSAAVREVSGSNPGVPLYNFWKTREKGHRSREYTWLGTKNIVTVLKQPARVCGDVIEYACSGDTAQW